MLRRQRIFVSFGTALIAAVVCLIIIQSFFQDAGGQSEDPGVPTTNGEKPSFTEPDGGEFERGEIIVKLEEDATRADLRDLNQSNEARIEKNLPESDVSVVDLPDDLGVGEAVEIYEDSPDVEYAEPDFLVYPSQATPSDSFYSEMYCLNNTGQTGGAADADIDAPEAWSTETGGPETLVAVIDEGVDVNHPDPRENIWVNEDETPGNGFDDDGNGYVDDINGWDCANDDNTVYDPDLLTGKGDEHGTHVAGTVAATGDNAQGVSGVNWQADIMVLKFLKPDGGRLSDAIEAIDYAVANGAGISNNSWGCGGCNSQSLKDAISRADDADHLFVAAAGNQGVDNDDPAVASYPASYDNPNIISVAATDDDDRLAGFSNFGDQTVDLGAPGVSILSTLPNNNYAYFSGTSMASPHVAGVAALIKSQNPTLNDSQIKASILQSVENKISLSGQTVTGGRVNAAQALGVTLATDLSLGANPLALTFEQEGTTLSGRLTSGGDALGGRIVIL